MSGLKQVAYYGVAMLVLKGLGFIMLPVATRVLTQNEYGSLNFLVSISAVGSLLLCLGLPELLFKQHYANNVSRLSFFRDCLTVSIFVCSALLLIVFFFAQYIVSFFPGNVEPTNLKLLSINLFASSILAIPYSYFRLMGNAKRYCFLAVTHGLLQTSLSIILLLIGYGVTGVMFSGAVSAMLVLLMTMILISSELKVSFSGYKWQLTSNHAIFLASILISSSCMYASNGAENWFIIAQEGEKALAIYFVAAQFALMTSFTFEPIRMWWFAKRFDVLSSSPKIYGYLALRSLNIGLALCAVMIVVTPVLFKVALPQSYHGNDMWLIGLILVVICRHHSDIFNIACYKYKNGTWVTCINAGCAFLIITAFYIFIPLYQINGVVVSLIAVQFLRSLVFIYVSQMLEYVLYEYHTLFVPWASIFLLIIINYVESQYSIFLQLLVLAFLLAFLIKQYREEVKQCLSLFLKRRAYV